MRKMSKSKKTFTLIELIVVIAIVAVLAVMGLIVAGVCIGGCYAYSSVKEDGLKGTAEQIWEGDKDKKVTND